VHGLWEELKSYWDCGSRGRKCLDLMDEKWGTRLFEQGVSESSASMSAPACYQ
jgi:hypothetical protein